MAITKFLKGIAKDLKKGAKGSKEYQAEKAKRKAKRAKSPLGKAVKSVAGDIKKGLKGSKEYQAERAKKKAVKAKKKEGKTWTKAVKKQKKAGGSSMNELIKARNAAKASGDKSAYAAAQNQINKAYGSKKVHKADAPKKAEKKKVDAKVDVRNIVKNLAKSKSKKADKKKVAPPESPVGKEEYAPKPGQTSTLMRNNPKKKEKAGMYGKDREGRSGNYAEGGKVEGNPYGWPSKDSRKR